jgi:hypothetical protein
MIKKVTNQTNGTDTIAITITISLESGAKLALTMDDAKELFEKLNAMFGPKHYPTVIREPINREYEEVRERIFPNYPSPEWPIEPPYPSTPKIWCGDQPGPKAC